MNNVAGASTKTCIDDVSAFKSAASKPPLGRYLPARRRILESLKEAFAGDRSGPTSDAQVPRLNVHCAHIANIRRTDSTVADAVDAIVRASPVDRSLVADSSYR